MGVDKMNLLEGVRVLDLSGLIPGPYASLLLADLGAEVIKVESRLGDLMRQVPPLVGGQGAYYLSLNRGKQSLGLDLKKPAGRALFLDLVVRSDVVIESFRPGRIERMGIGYTAARAVNPAIVYCSISGYGQNGPDADRAGHDITYLARSGVLGLNRHPGAPPVLPPVLMADFAAGTNAALAVCAALFRRSRSGLGCHLDISMLEGMTAWMGFHWQAHLAGATAAPGALPLAGRYPFYNVYATADGGFIALGALEALFWSDFCRAVGRPDLAGMQFADRQGESGNGDGEKGDGGGRHDGQNGQDAQERTEVFGALTELFASRDAAAWAELFRSHDLPAEVVNSLDEVLVDPHLAARGSVVILEHPEAGRLVQAAAPMRLVPPMAVNETGIEDAETSASPGLPPALGADTRRVLAGVLDLAPGEIDNLIASRVVFGSEEADPRRVAPEVLP